MSFTLTTTRSRSVTHTIVTGLSDMGRIRKRNEDSVALFPDLSSVFWMTMWSPSIFASGLPKSAPQKPLRPHHPLWSRPPMTVAA